MIIIDIILTIYLNILILINNICNHRLFIL